MGWRDGAEPPSSADGRPVLVTGVPRSGTTWLARELARSRGAGLAGREPMNPRRGQFGLGGTLDSWVELDDPSSRQVRLLRRCYAGREPRVLSRYGEHQASSVLPWRTTVVKDPFALLSLPCVARVTGAQVVVVYRPAGAVLASYRRMGWTADTAELRALPAAPRGPLPGDDVDAMAEFWNHLHTRALDRLDEVPDAVLVSHEELAAGGEAALDELRQRCGLRPARPIDRRRAARRPRDVGTPAGRPRLHDFRRTSEQVTGTWRQVLDERELDRLDRATADVWRRLEGTRTGLVV